MPPLPQPPEIDYSYTGFATGLGDGSFPGTQIDNDFANVVTAATEVTDFLASTFRSDGVLKATAYPTAGDLRAYAAELVSPSLESFREGVGVGNAVADTEAWKAALAYGGTIRVLGKTYYLGEGGTATKRIALIGEHTNRIVPTADFSATEDVVRLAPEFGQLLVGWAVIGLDIQPAADGVARHAIEIDHTADQYVSNSGLVIERVTVGTPLTIDTARTVGGYALHYTPHPSDADGLFCSVFRDCTFTGGIYMTRAGDSLNFERLKLYGSGRGMYIECVGGAANLRIVGCNITTSGGAIHVKNSPLARIEDCQIEMLSAWTGDADADNRAILVLEDCPVSLINNNNVHASLFTSDHAHCISLRGTSARCRIAASNRLVTTSPYEHIHSVSSQAPAVIAEQMPWVEQPPNTIITNPVATFVAGTAIGLWSAAMTLENSWVASTLSGALWEGLFYKIMPDGTVHLRGSVSSGTNVDNTTIATLPLEARPSKITRLTAQVYNGSDYVTCVIGILTGGEIRILDALVANTVLNFDNVFFDRT